MRKGTKTFVGIISLGVVAAGYQVGLAAEISSGFSVAAEAATAVASPVNTATPTSAPAATSSIPSGATSSTPPAPNQVTAQEPSSTPKATVPAPAQNPAPNTASATKDGSAVRYQYGTVQVSVTKAGGKITAVNLLQSGATDGRQAAFTYLVDLAVQANGSSFGNLSGATYTTDAFKQSLEAALAKF